MTISYNYLVGSSGYFTYLRILFGFWRGSFWASVSRELVGWLFGYLLVSAFYRCVLLPGHWPAEQHAFDMLVNYLHDHEHSIPVNFVLGFFVHFIVERWKGIFDNIGFVDLPAHYIATYVRGTDPHAVAQRRKLVRYMCLTHVLVLRDLSVMVEKRFPRLSRLVDDGLLDEREKLVLERKIAEARGTNLPEHDVFWTPMQWAFETTYHLYEQGYIEHAQLLSALNTELRNYRDKLKKLVNYDWVPVPLAYTQVVFFAVRLYLLVFLLARQQVATGDAVHNAAFGVPWITIVQVTIYLGWLKVAEVGLNPLGDDDDDFECNFIIDRNIIIGMSLIEQQCETTSSKLLHGGGGDGSSWKPSIRLRRKWPMPMEDGKEVNPDQQHQEPQTHQQQKELREEDKGEAMRLSRQTSMLCSDEWASYRSRPLLGSVVAAAASSASSASASSSSQHHHNLNNHQSPLATVVTSSPTSHHQLASEVASKARSRRQFQPSKGIEESLETEAEEEDGGASGASESFGHMVARYSTKIPPSNGRAQ